MWTLPSNWHTCSQRLINKPASDVSVYAVDNQSINKPFDWLTVGVEQLKSIVNSVVRLLIVNLLHAAFYTITNHVRSGCFEALNPLTVRGATQLSYRTHGMRLRILLDLRIKLGYLVPSQAPTFNAGCILCCLSWTGLSM